MKSRIERVGMPGGASGVEGFSSLLHESAAVSLAARWIQTGRQVPSATQSGAAIASVPNEIAGYSRRGPGSAAQPSFERGPGALPLAVCDPHRPGVHPGTAGRSSARSARNPRLQNSGADHSIRPSPPVERFRVRAQPSHGNALRGDGAHARGMLCEPPLHPRGRSRAAQRRSEASLRSAPGGTGPAQRALASAGGASWRCVAETSLWMTLPPTRGAVNP